MNSIFTLTKTPVALFLALGHKILTVKNNAVQNAIKTINLLSPKQLNFRYFINRHNDKWS